MSFSLADSRDTPIIKPFGIYQSNECSVRIDESFSRCEFSIIRYAIGANFPFIDLTFSTLQLISAAFQSGPKLWAAPDSELFVPNAGKHHNQSSHGTKRNLRLLRAQQPPEKIRKADVYHSYPLLHHRIWGAWRPIAIFRNVLSTNLSRHHYHQPPEYPVNYMGGVTPTLGSLPHSFR